MDVEAVANVWTQTDAETLTGSTLRNAERKLPTPRARTIPEATVDLESEDPQALDPVRDAIVQLLLAAESVVVQPVHKHVHQLFSESIDKPRKLSGLCLECNCLQKTSSPSSYFDLVCLEETGASWTRVEAKKPSDATDTEPSFTMQHPQHRCLEKHSSPSAKRNMRL